MNVHVRNNILWVEGGAALSVASESQVGFASNFNVFWTPEAGYVAFWQGGARPTLLSWQSTAFTDGNSVSRDPRFVSPAGADGVLGYASPVQVGRDDDFHEQSLHGSYHGGSPAPVDTGGGTGAPAPLTGECVNDALQSPAIDRGALADSDGNEPAPSGNYITIGAYGNTAPASRSPAAVRDHDDRGLAGARFPALNDGLLLRIDDDAASRGWFIGPTPADDAEFFGTVQATVWRRAGTARHSTGSTCCRS